MQSVNPSDQPLFLGIDAGGTKTTAVIGTLDKDDIGRHTGGPANLEAVKEADLIRNVRTAVRGALKSAGVPRTQKFKTIVIGMAGIDSDADQRKASRVLRKALKGWFTSSTRIQILNDVRIVRRSGSDKPYGLGIIAGTGSHGFGQNAKGETAHVSGFGYLLADGGSGYWIGLQALRKAVRMNDGRLKTTPLFKAVLKKLGVKNLRDALVDIRKFTKKDIASLAITVENAAVKGDATAKLILEEAISNLVEQTDTLVRRLDMRRSTFDIVVVGGMFTMPKYPFLKHYTQQIKRIAPKATVVCPTDKPVVGAVRLARDSYNS